MQHKVEAHLKTIRLVNQLLPVGYTTVARDLHFGKGLTMYEHREDEVGFCDDFSPMEEESMPETLLHAWLIQYLVEVLKWLFRGYLCVVCKNLAFYPLPQFPGPLVAPFPTRRCCVSMTPTTSSGPLGRRLVHNKLRLKPKPDGLLRDESELKQKLDKLPLGSLSSFCLRNYAPGALTPSSYEPSAN